VISEEPDSPEPVSPEAEAIWSDFWAPIVIKDGVLDLDQVKKELADYHDIMGEVSEVYDHVTGGRISKINTLAFHVISAADELEAERTAEAIKDALPIKQIRERLAQHQENLRLWQDGTLSPTEPDEEERSLTMERLRVAIHELEWVLGQSIN
jgi:hypothetical protein